MVLEIMDLHNSRVEPELNRSFYRPKGWIFKTSPCISPRLKKFLSFSPQTFISVQSLPHQKPFWHTIHKRSLCLFLLYQPCSNCGNHQNQGRLIKETKELFSAQRAGPAFLPKISLMPQRETCYREVTPEVTHLHGNPSCSIRKRSRASTP